MKKVAPTFCFALITQFAFANAKDDAPALIKAAFQKLHPTATHVKWGRKMTNTRPALYRIK